MNAAPFSLSPGTATHGDVTVCDLSLGEPRRQEFPGSLCKNLLDRVAINHYYPAFGLLELRQEVHTRFYPALDPSTLSIFMTHGAIHGIDLLLRAALKAGDEILLPDPGFPPYQKLAEFNLARCKTYSLRAHAHGFAFDVERIAEALTPATRILVINSPNNPSGAMLSAQQREDLRILLLDYPELLVISDEVYSEIIYSEKLHYSLAGLTPKTYVVNSFSKTFGLQGFRIGWIAAPRHHLPKLGSYLQNSVGCVSSLGQEIVLELMATAHWTPCCYQDARQLASLILSEAGLQFALPEGAFFILIRVADDALAAHLLAEEGIKVVPGHVFGSTTRGWIRACFAQKDGDVRRDFQRLAHSIKRLHLDDL